MKYHTMSNLHGHIMPFFRIIYVKPGEIPLHPEDHRIQGANVDPRGQVWCNAQAPAHRWSSPAISLRWPVKRWNIAREKSWLLDILGTFMYFPRPSCSWLPIGTTYGWSAHLSWDDLKFLWSVRAPWPMQNQGGPAYALGDGKTHNGRGLVRSQPQDFGSKLGPLAQPIPNRTFNFRATSCKGGGFCMRRELQQPTLSC